MNQNEQQPERTAMHRLQDCPPPINETVLFVWWHRTGFEASQKTLGFMTKESQLILDLTPAGGKKPDFWVGLNWLSKMFAWRNTPTMANDNQTALMMSIQRRKEDLRRMTFDYDNNIDPDSSASARILAVIRFLEHDITEDEKMLAVDRNEIELAYNTGRNDSRSEIPEENDRTATTYYAQRFGA